MAGDRVINGGGKATNLENPGFFQRAGQAIKYAIAGVTPDNFFGPAQPLTPSAQESEGRAFDYPTSYNINISPRSNEPIGFSTMRALADNYDLLRIVIETRKDQLTRMKWRFSAKDKNKARDNDPRITELETFFAYPDKEHDWQTWYRMILEDLFVIDAPSVYLQKTRGGLTGPQKPFALQIIDGATITRKIDATGRTPLAPNPAYQQILKGVPASDYTCEELLYLPRNPRPHKIYGYSPVEQIIMTVNIALRRQLHQLEFYTEGNTPDLLLKCPESWQPDQIQKMQMFWDTLTTTENRRKGRFIPGGVEPYDTKQKELKDAFDEWLARVVCFCFSIAPTPFIQQVNRATAESAEDTAQKEGLEPILTWTKGLMDRVISQHFGYTDLEAGWDIPRELDPQVKVDIDDKNLRNGSVTLNELRKERGQDPLPDGDEPMIYTSQGAVLLKDIINPPEPEPVPPSLSGQMPISGEEDKKPVEADPKDLKEEERIERVKKKIIKPIDRKRPFILKQQAKAEKILKKFFSKAAKDIAEQVGKLAGLAERVEQDDEVDRILADIEFERWSDLIGPMKDVIELTYIDGTVAALAQVGVGNQEHLTDLLNERSLTYAEDRAAELVGMRIMGGEWVPNPDAKWAITESTRDMVRNDVTTAIDEGWSTQHLAKELKDNQAFSGYRAEMIARTEIRFADVAGNMEAYKQSGVVQGKEWIVGSEHDDDDECTENEDAGVIALDDEFPSGDSACPAHPNCICDILPVLIDEEPTDQDGPITMIDEE